jgi:hypothetical protein
MNRYRNTPLIKRQSEPTHFCTWELPEKLKVLSPIDWFGKSTPVIHTWSVTDRLDKLANKYYNDDTMWWIIAMANNIPNPLAITAGTVIKIPTDSKTVLDQLNL